MKSRELYRDTLWRRRKVFCDLLFCLAICLFFLSPPPAKADLPISVSTTYSDPSQVYVTFQTSFPSTFSASYYSNSARAVVQITAAPAPSFLTPSIRLSDIKDGIINLVRFGSAANQVWRQAPGQGSEFAARRSPMPDGLFIAGRLRNLFPNSWYLRAQDT
jgi:hypothetical protein